MSSKPRVLIVDDDASITELLSTYLAGFGFEVRTASDGKAMRAALAQSEADLVVLDVMLPGDDGLVLSRELRRQRARLPIIMLTARAEAYDRVIGLEMGADDYLCKPFEPRELVARIRTVLRRASRPTVEPPLIGRVCFDGWELRLQERNLLSPRGVVVPLSNAEFRLLSTFLRMPRRVCTRDQLMEQARGRAMDSFERSIDLLVSRLRQKLAEDAEAPSLIKTVRGAGYLFNARSVQGMAEC
ncbi:response regulator [Hylemonella gracilis]|uniref:Response regulator n=1 Tax=Hylemonella gracilis TaxID=80880 RepID=A0A4V1A249_9BURK|nr:response regulator [Hylemonella gracilis]QBK04809.1 response regulator [Hylemonella gracilis]